MVKYLSGYSASNCGLLDGSESPSDSHSFTNGHWSKVAVVPPCLLLLAIVNTFFSSPTVQNIGDAGKTNLIGLAPSMPGATRMMRAPMLRPGAALMSTQLQAIQDKFKTLGISSGPLQNLALTAIDANNRGNQMRDVSLQAKTIRAADSQMISGWSLVDSKTKTELLKVLDRVKNKEQMLAGVSAPMNYFDPLGFSTPTTAGKLLFFREVELKHGRVAMLAALGILVGEQFHPLFGGDIDVPSYVAFQQTPLENFWPAVVTAIAIPEIFSVFQFQDPSKGEMWAMKEDHEPGNLGFDPLGLRPTDPKELKDMQTKELNNGRLAMIAAAGMIAQEIATDSKLF